MLFRNERDLVAAADAWADRMYMLLDEVHRSNMSKVCADGQTEKAIKNAEFAPPNLLPIMNAQLIINLKSESGETIARRSSRSLIRQTKPIQQPGCATAMMHTTVSGPMPRCGSGWVVS